VTIPQVLEMAVRRHKEGRLTDAEALYRQILGLQPNHPDAMRFLGIIAQQVGRHDVAVEWIRRALACDPNHALAHSNLGEVYCAAGRLDDAIVAFRRALQLNPKSPETLNSLGAALAGKGLTHEAVSTYRRALELKPDHPDAHNNLGVALRDQGKGDEAIESFRRAVQLKPDHLEALTNLASALKRQGELDEAIAAHRRALLIKPECAWAHSNLISTLYYHPRHDAMTIAEEHERWNRQFSDPQKQFVLPHANNRNPERRLRVGYVSPDFLDHVVARFALPLVERHDRGRFEILCYSGVKFPDPITERFRALAGKWRDTAGISDARLAELIREDGVDILVDLTMHAAHNRLPMFARQPAPVQVAWLSYPGSTGLPGIGYRLTDACMDPPGEKPAWSAEEPVRLPDCWCCYQPIGETPENNALPALSAERVTFGSLNNFAKVNERVLALWTRVLHGVKESRLLMFCPEGRTRERVWAFLHARGITTDRVEFVGFVPRWEYLRLYHRIDVGLDSFPYNGMTTTCDALWMGVPVLTLPGATPVSRAGLSLLSSVGLSEFVASSEEDYVRIAAELAGNLPRLAELRAELRPRMQSSPLMDAPRFARNVEAAYRSMWHRWCLRPPSIRADV
jgi:protein O-GlcNAc transferase